ncbi:MAG: two-component regulator propeller domain-containing protein [Chitinophagaceae bacterium]
MSMQGQYYFDNLTEKNGLSDDRITCFLKDKTGFLWIGTKNGLNRYDGSLFKVFKPGVGNSISNEVINDIVQDAAGKIWVATMSGLNIYDPLSNRWETIMPDSGEVRTGIPNYLIWDLAVDEKNQVWIVSDVWQLSVIDPVTRKFTYYDWPSVWEQKPIATLSLYKSIQKIVRKNEKEWWLGTTVGLFSVDMQSKQFKFYGVENAASVKDLMYDKLHGNVFMVTDNGQLFCYEEKKNIYHEIKTNDQVYPATSWNRKKDEKDLLLMPHTRGLLEINTNTLEATVISHRPALSSTLFPGGTNSIYTDSAGSLWVGTSNGINYRNNYNQITDFIPLTIASDKESTDGMSSVLYDTTDNRYYITSLFSNEVFVIDDLTGNIFSINSIDGKPLSACTNIRTDNHDNIWLLTETNVYRYDRGKMKFVLFNTPNNGDPVIFHDLLEDKKGDYWLASFQGGAYHYKTKEDKFYTYSIEDDLYSKSITALKNDPVDNAVWLGSFNYGLFRYDLDSNTFRPFTNNEQMDLIRDLETDAFGKLWLSTYVSGLYFYRKQKSNEKSFTNISAKNGLTQSGYYSIAADNKNRLWLLSAKGLSAIDQNGNFLYEVRKHPVIGFSNYAPAVSYPKRIFYNTKKNELLVPVAGGLMLYYPDKNIPATKFPVVLTDISVGGRSVIYDSSYFGNGSIDIPYKSNSLSFRFAALNYIDKEDIRYEYKLHESDAEWTSLGNSSTVNFPDITSGKYTFLIRAKTSNGDISGNTASFSFRILPPFWKTWWFILLLCFAAGALVYLIYRYQLNKKLEVERLRLRISRDLHDDIGSALTSINVLSKVALSKGGDQTEMSGYLSRIKDSTMITMESMSDIVWAINPRNDKLGSLMSRMKEFAADIGEAQGIDLDFTLPVELEKLSLDLSKRKNLFLIFKEAINNAVKYSQCTLLKIKFDRSGNRLNMIIQDNGKGFDQSAIVPGNGLHNMKERAGECNGDLHIDSSVGHGTSITLEIPITRFGV